MTDAGMGTQGERDARDARDWLRRLDDEYVRALVGQVDELKAKLTVAEQQAVGRWREFGDARDRKRAEAAESALAEAEKERDALAEALAQAQVNLAELEQAEARVAELEAATEPETLAQAFHENYERLAPGFQYETREASAVPWADVPDTNKQLMIATARAALAAVREEQT